MTTPTPAQADEKALVAAQAAARDSNGCGCTFAGETVFCDDPRLPDPDTGNCSCKRDAEAAVRAYAALRPEGEAVAWVQPGYLAMLQKYGNCSMRAEPIEPLDYIVPLFASPPAPAGVKVRDLIEKARAYKPYNHLNDGSLVRDLVDALASLLPPSTEEQAGSASTPAEALPSQTSGMAGVRTGAEMIARHRFRLADDGNCAEIDSNGLAEEIDAALAKPASEPAVGGVDAAQQLLDKALRVLGRCHTVLFNMAKENEGAIFNRWPIHHEPLRSDARNLLPLIDEVLGHD